MRLAPGATFNEKQLCQEFGVSRTPVREALLRLCRGKTRRHLSPDRHLRDAHRARRPCATRWRCARRSNAKPRAQAALKRARPSEAAKLRRIIARQRECAAAKALEEFHALDEALHQAIAEIAGHPNFWRVIKREKAQVDRFRLLTLPMPRRLALRRRRARGDRRRDRRARRRGRGSGDAAPSAERAAGLRRNPRAPSRLFRT